MELSSKYVGLCSRPLEIEVTARQSMGYAAGVSDNNPWYFDDERAHGPLAPPMLSISLTWKLASHFADFWDVGDFPVEVLAQQVHYSETIEWHRVMRPGDQLIIQGEVAAILPHRAGTHLVLRFDAHDPQGRPVFTEYIGGMLRGVNCTDAGAGNAPKAPTRAGVNDILWEERLHVDPLAPWIYDVCGNVPFPIHTSYAFARGVGLPGVIYQGTATLALALREITNHDADADPRRVRAISCNFTGMVEPNSDIVVRAIGREQTDTETLVYFHVLNASGHKAIRNGCVRLLPRETL